MNVYDSEKIRDILHKTFNAVGVESAKDADVVIINTCSIRDKAQEKVFHQIGRWKKIKKFKKNLIIGVGGCVASQEGADLFKRDSCIDIVFGPQTIHRIPTLINQKLITDKPQIDISFPEIEKFDYFPAPKVRKYKSFVSIMEGCDKYCSYCIVPYTRGSEFSRPLEDVVGECAFLVKQGIKEITLLGQNVNHYLGSMGSLGGEADLAFLISILSEIKGLERIRFMTSHPVNFSDRLIDTYKNFPKLSNHLHLPVQHASNKILLLIKRGHTIEEFKEKIYKIRKVRKNISISSDFIVGFPSETEKDFRELIDLVKELEFDQSYSFIYSKRPGTLAANMQDDLTQDVKKSRLLELQKVLKSNIIKISRRMLETTQKVLIDHNKEDLKHSCSSFGYTENNRSVKISGKKISPGQLVKVKIINVSSFLLEGLLLS